jgi:hypothetical protein
MAHGSVCIDLSRRRVRTVGELKAHVPEPKAGEREDARFRTSGMGSIGVVTSLDQAGWHARGLEAVHQLQDQLECARPNGGSPLLP